MGHFENKKDTVARRCVHPVSSHAKTSVCCMHAQWPDHSQSRQAPATRSPTAPVSLPSLAWFVGGVEGDCVCALKPTFCSLRAFVARLCPRQREATLTLLNSSRLNTSVLVKQPTVLPSILALHSARHAPSKCTSAARTSHAGSQVRAFSATLTPVTWSYP